MPRCQHCGATVTPSFVRVFAGRDGQVHACPNCADTTQIQDGAAADPTYDLDGDVSERRTISVGQVHAGRGGSA